MAGLGTCQPRWCSSQNEITHPLRVKRGRNISAMIVWLMGCKCTPPDEWKWQEHVSHYGAAHEMGTHACLELTVAGTCQPWWCYSWDINTHLLIIENGRNKSAMMVQLTKCNYAPTESQNGRKGSATIMLLIKYKYALPDNQKWQEHVSRDGAAHEPWLCTHWVKSSWNMSAIIVLLLKYKYPLPDSRKWQEHISHDNALHEMRIRTHWESKVAGTCQSQFHSSWNINMHLLMIENGRNMSAMRVQPMKWDYAPTESQKWQERVSHDYASQQI